MTDQTGSTAGSEAVFELPADAPEVFNTTREAAEYFTSLKEKKSQPAESAEPATAEPELAKASDDPAEPAPIEEPDEAEPAEVPLIDPPRSWTKAEKERFQSLPREMQEYLHTREQERDRDVRRSQNEVAEERKAAKAEREAAEQLRKQYEAKLPTLEKKLQTVGPFADIQSHDDLRKLQQNDPFRFQEYQLYVWEQQAEQQELREAETRKTQERQSKRANYEAEQNKALVELVPEMADAKKAGELRERAIAMLTDDLGLKTDLLSQWMADDTGHEILSNAGIQKLIADGLKYRDILKAPKAVVKADLPPVQRPGTSKPPGATASAKLQALETAFNRTGSVKDATALYAAQLEAQSRRRA